MPAPRLIDVELLKKHFEDTGNIRETSRRLNRSYTAVYDRLVRLNLIRAPTFDAGRVGHTARTIPEATTLVIPDLQAPAHHPDALAFLCAVRDKYRSDREGSFNVVCIGDELDLNWLSDFAKLPEADQPHSEFAAAQAFLRSLFAEFPEAVSCTSNHVHGRFDKARIRGRIPPAFLRPLEDLIDAPVGWSWHSSIRMGDILFRHGHKDSSALKRIIVEEIPAQHGRHLSLVIGHFHSKFGVATPDIKIGDKFFYGAFVGCLVDPSHPFFGYSKGTEKLGCAVIVHGRFIPIAMPVLENGRWSGVLP
jgi:hypothetical protein